MARPTALADTSGIIALLDRSDRHHQAVIQIFKQYSLIVPSTTLPEIDYLASKYLGEPAVRAFFKDLIDGYYTYQTVEVQDIQSALQIMNQYQGVPLGIVDSSIIAIAERYKISRIKIVVELRSSLPQNPSTSKFVTNQDNPKKPYSFAQATPPTNSKNLAKLQNILNSDGIRVRSVLQNREAHDRPKHTLKSEY